jgi:hypothetical protein
MKYTVEIGSDAMIYIPSLIKFGSDIQKLIREIKNTQTGSRSHKPISRKQAKNKSRLMKSHC